MKRIILSAVVAAAAIFGGYTASQESEFAMSDLQLENLEALAGGEDRPPCPYGIAETKKPGFWDDPVSGRDCECQPVQDIVIVSHCYDHFGKY